MCLGDAQAVLGGSGGMIPREKFGNMELNPAILCVLAIKTKCLQYGYTHRN